jgi:phospholipase C
LSIWQRPRPPLHYLPNKTPTTSPIKHLIVIIGENRSFDDVFATYQPKNGETVPNLLSKGIIRANGKPGSNYAVVPKPGEEFATYGIAMCSNTKTTR